MSANCHRLASDSLPHRHHHHPQHNLHTERRDSLLMHTVQRVCCVFVFTKVLLPSSALSTGCLISMGFSIVP